MNNDFITCEFYCNKELPRYYIINKIKYDFEKGGWYSTLCLDKTKESRKYGTFEAAKKYAEALYNKYKKELGEDLEIIIKDELIHIDKILKEKEKAEKSAEYYNELLNKCIDLLIKDNSKCYYCSYRKKETCPDICPDPKKEILNYLRGI